MQQWVLLHSVASACSQNPSVGILTLRQSMLWHLLTVHYDSDVGHSCGFAYAIRIR